MSKLCTDEPLDVYPSIFIKDPLARQKRLERAIDLFNHRKSRLQGFAEEDISNKKLTAVRSKGAKPRPNHNNTKRPRRVHRNDPTYFTLTGAVRDDPHSSTFPGFSDLDNDLFRSFSGPKLWREKDATGRRENSYFSRRSSKMRNEARRKEELERQSREAKPACSGGPGCLITCCSYLMEGAASNGRTSLGTMEIRIFDWWMAAIGPPPVSSTSTSTMW